MDYTINERNDQQEIIDKALRNMAEEFGAGFDPNKANLAEFCRLTGITRSKARKLKADGFKVKPHGNVGRKHGGGILAEHTEALDGLLRSGVTNSSVCFDAIRAQGYEGGLTTVKTYIRDHQNLVPAKRKIVSPQTSRGQRYQTNPGEAYQMDWGFVKVEGPTGEAYKIACFAMVCHHCGTPYVEFFPNARQENLFIGMIHAFMVMGVPDYVLTDNMKSVVIRRDADGKPVWQGDYAAFMACIGFKTRLCKPRHPFTKGKVERLIRFVKDNFLAGRCFSDVTQLNTEALLWCSNQASRYHRAIDLVPADEHTEACLLHTRQLVRNEQLAMYLCPLRRITFDGFVNYEGRRFGVPYWYPSRTCRVNRDGGYLHIYSDDLSRELVVHPVTWSHKDCFCQDQYADVRPCELPSTPIKTVIRQLDVPKARTGFDRFDFEGRL